MRRTISLLSKQELRQKRTIEFFRLVEKGDHPSMCWSWKGSFNGKYGDFRFEGRRSMKAHVVSYLIHTGQHVEDIPEDPTHPGFRMSVLHKCPNKYCSNPLHLKLGTFRENMTDKNWERARRVSKDEVVQIISLWISTGMSRVDVSRMVGVNPGSVSKILLGKSHIDVLPQIRRPIEKNVTKEEPDVRP